jgi:hypothetical protein
MNMGKNFMRTRSKRTLGGIVLAVVLAAAAVATGAPAAAQPGGNAQLNQPSYYEGLGYGTCSKTENPSDPYVLGPAPAGSYWSLLVLKAGSEASNDDWNTMIQNPAPGEYVHPSGKDLSHIIVCFKPGSPPSTTTTTTTTLPGGPCDDYTPTQVAVDPSTVQAGGQVVITGVALPGDTVTATLSGGSITPTPLGSATADAAGQFSITATVPTGISAGSYTITVSSTQCPASVDITIVVVSTVFSGCGTNNAARTIERGSSVVWALHVPSFNTSSPVTLRLKKSGYNQVLYSGPWPASNDVTVTIPATAPTGQYTMEQVGTKKNGKGSMTKTCPIWLEFTSSPVSATIDGGGAAGAAAPLGYAALVAVACVGLVRLGSRRATLRFRAKA